MAIDGTVSTTFNLNDRRTVGLTTSANLPVNTTPSFTYTDGSGALGANLLYQATRTFSGSTDNVDLAGVLTDSYGSTVTLVRVKAILIVNNSTTNTVTVGAGTNPWLTLLNSTGTVTLPAGAWFAAATGDATGWAVTAGTGDILKLAGTSGQTYNLIVVGASS